MKKKITNVAEFKTFIEKKLEQAEKDAQFYIIKFIYLEKRKKLTSEGFIQLLPHITYKNWTFYKNLLTDLPKWVNDWKKENKNTNINFFYENLFCLLISFLENEKTYFKNWQNQFMEILENIDFSCKSNTIQLMLWLAIIYANTKCTKLLQAILINPKISLNISEQTLIDSSARLPAQIKKAFDIRICLQKKELFNELPFNKETINNLDNEFEATNIIDLSKEPLIENKVNAPTM